jgi:uncharacterized protein
MTPQERHLIDDLFDRLAGLETSPRDPEAERSIIDGLRRAPNAAYALVQTALVQDEALKRANARIEELQGTQAPATSSGSFLESMRDVVFGQGQRGSVPNIHPSDAGASRPVWNGNYPAATPAYPGAGFGGGSFLGTAAAVAAGTIGGSMLMNGIRGLMGGGRQGFGDPNAFSTNPSTGPSAGPWGGDQSNSSLARDAGIGDIGRDNSGGASQSQGLFDSTSADDPNDSDDFDGDDDFGADNSDSDFA